MGRGGLFLDNKLESNWREAIILSDYNHPPYKLPITRELLTRGLTLLVAGNAVQFTEALKGHHVVWKIDICYLIRMILEWKRMSSG